MTVPTRPSNLAIQDSEQLEAYRIKAGQGDAQAQCDLGECHVLGKLVPRDEVYAAALYQLAAAQGHAQAISNLAVCYFTGTGVFRDDDEALRLLKSLYVPYNKRRSAPAILSPSSFSTSSHQGIIPSRSDTRSASISPSTSINSAMSANPHAFYGHGKSNISSSPPPTPKSSVSGRWVWATAPESRATFGVITPKKQRTSPQDSPSSIHLCKNTF